MRISLDVVKKPQGIIVYQGKSQLNGKPIVAIATGLNTKSANGKTGEIVQIYIIAAGISPVKALYNGKDEAVCGDCPHRVIEGTGTCYVNPAHGPLAIQKAHANGNYDYPKSEEAARILSGRVVRLGAYGDPAAVPLAVWDAILVDAAGWTGYSHQWRKPIAKGLNRYCMASVETPRQQAHAIRKGWRTFRIRENAEDAMQAGEIVCPASAEAGKRLTCDTCKACSGGNVKKASIAIIAHGTNWKRIRLVKMIRMLKQKKKLKMAAK
jgi:hypothetical protein